MTIAVIAAIRMRVDAAGSPDGMRVYAYAAGQTYSETSDPRASQDLMRAFVSSGRATELDAQGNPISAPDQRATKVNGPSATKTVESATPAPSVLEAAPAPAPAPEPTDERTLVAEVTAAVEAAEAAKTPKNGK